MTQKIRKPSHCDSARNACERPSLIENNNLNLTGRVRGPAAFPAAALLIAGSALAADLPTRKAPPPMLAPAFSWAGSYVGVNLGYGFGQNDPMLSAAVYTTSLGKFGPTGNSLQFPLAGGSENISGILGGIQAGHNFQISPMFVLGLEADFQGTGISGSTSVAGAVAGLPAGPLFNSILSVGHSQRVNWFGTGRVRAGFALPSAPNFLIYATGGLAFGNVSHTLSATQIFNVGVLGLSTSTSSTRLGFTVGGGFEYVPMTMQRWSFKLEYLYTDLGRSSLAAGPMTTRIAPFIDAANVITTIATARPTTRFRTVRMGVNYRFGSVASAPVVAKY